MSRAWCIECLKVLQDNAGVVDKLMFEQAIKDLEKLSQIETIINATEYIENGAIYSYCYNQERKVAEIRRALNEESNIETCFSEAKEELQDVAVKNIMGLEPEKKMVKDIEKLDRIQKLVDSWDSNCHIGRPYGDYYMKNIKEVLEDD